MPHAVPHTGAGVIGVHQAVNYSLSLEGKEIRWLSFNCVEFSGSRCGRVGGVHDCLALQEREAGPGWAGKRCVPGQRLGCARAHLGTTAGTWGALSSAASTPVDSRSLQDLPGPRLHPGKTEVMPTHHTVQQRPCNGTLAVAVLWQMLLWFVLCHRYYYQFSIRPKTSHEQVTQNDPPGVPGV